MGIKKNFDPLFYLVTDPGLSLGRSEEEVVQRAVSAGVTMVQYRDKEAGPRRMVEKARALVSICRPLGIPLIVNDRIDVALAAGADGVHLGQDDLDPTDARRVAGGGFIIGVSVTTPEEARRAEEDGADYIAANGVFPTGTKAGLGPPLGLKGVSSLSAATQLPLVGIGGIDHENAAGVLASGASGVAVVSFITQATDIEARCVLLRSVLEGGTRS